MKITVKIFHICFIVKSSLSNQNILTCNSNASCIFFVKSGSFSSNLKTKQIEFSTFFNSTCCSQGCQLPYISREILVKNMTKLYQFDLFAGQYLLLQNFIQTFHLCVLRQFKTLLQIFDFLILVNFFQFFFHSTYTQGELYASIYGTCRHNILFQ